MWKLPSKQQFVREPAEEGARNVKSRLDQPLKEALHTKPGGGLVFWATTIATSLLPIAAEYRAAYSNWKIQTVWVDSLFVGLITACSIGYFLVRSLSKIPTKNPVLESAKLGFAALVMVTILIDVPRSIILPGPSAAMHYFLIGVLFNAARFLLLGFVIGCLYKRLYGSA